MKRILPFFLFLIIVLHLGWTGCDSDKSTDSHKIYPGDIIPLAIGNSWYYSILAVDSTNDTIFNKMLYSYHIIGDTLINQELWYNLWLRVEQESDSLFAPFKLWTNRDVGLWERNTKGDDPYLLWKYPTFVGDTYLFSSEADSEITTTACVIGTSEILFMDKRKYECVHYMFEIDSDTTYQRNTYLAPDIGLIKDVCYAFIYFPTTWFINLDSCNLQGK